jgi:SAM-dependent methyltransferase
VDRREWNRHADEFEEDICDITVDATNNQLSRFVRAVRLPSDPVLVDLGCGLGSFVQKFGGRFQKIFAVDFAGRIIARAKQRCAAQPGINWLVMDVARAFEAIGRRADLAVCMNVITSPSAAKRNALWRCVAKVTKPGGFALIVVPSIESNRMVQQMSTAARRDGSFASKGDGVVQHEDSWQKHFERRELVATMSDHGFRVKQIGRVSFGWSDEGLRSPRRAGSKSPWDWICLAQRV